MTKVLYRVGDKIISSYEEYLKIKGSAEPSYMFLAECGRRDITCDTFEEGVDLCVDALSKVTKSVAPLE